MAVVALEENGTVWENFVEIFLVGQCLGAEHGIVPAAAENPVVSRMFGGVFAQAFLDVSGVRGAFQIYAAEARASRPENGCGNRRNRGERAAPWRR